MEWMKLLYVIGSIVAVGLLIAYIRKNPLAFSKESMGKSFYVLGILALGLIGFIALVVMWLRNT